MNRALARHIRAQRAGRFNPARLNNADIAVQGSATAFSLFSVLALLVWGAVGFTTLAAIYATFALIGAVVFVIAVHIRNTQEGRRDALKAQAEADRKRADAEGLRAVAAALAEGEEPTIAEAA